MYTAQYQFADLSVAISSLHEDVHAMCRAYATDRPAVIMVSTTPADISRERERAAVEAVREGVDGTLFTDGYLETLAVYRQMAEQMCAYDIILLHGSCIALDGEGYLFTAPSGTGKSTHTRLWREHFGDRVFMVNDDKPLIRIRGGEVTAFGTPWDGKHHLSTNTSVPLKAVCLLERASENRVESMAFSAAFPTLLQQTYRSKDPTRLRHTMDLIGQMAAHVGVYRLGCNMDPDAAVVASRGMGGKD